MPGSCTHLCTRLRSSLLFRRYLCTCMHTHLHTSERMSMAHIFEHQVMPPHELGRPYPIIETTLLSPAFALPIDGLSHVDFMCELTLISYHFSARKPDRKELFLAHLSVFRADKWYLIRVSSPVRLSVCSQWILTYIHVDIHACTHCQKTTSNDFQPNRL